MVNVIARHERAEMLEERMRKAFLVVGLVLTMSIPGAPALAGDGSMATCPMAMTGAEFGAHVSAMAVRGELGAQMNPGMHRGYSPMVP